jgi:EAL domain-containing protein (putative c-di-GMP-specific phosphodiesterase class I)/GGDEF domain-containing protein
MLTLVLPLAVATLGLGVVVSADLLAIREDVTILRNAAHRSIEAERFARQLQVLLKESFDYVSDTSTSILEIESARAEAAASLARLEPDLDRGTRGPGHSLTLESLREWEDTRQQVDRHLERAFRLARDGRNDQARRIIAGELGVLIRSRVLSPLSDTGRRESVRLEYYAIRIARASGRWPLSYVGAPDVRRNLVPQIYQTILVERAQWTAYQEFNHYAALVASGKSPVGDLVGTHRDQSLHALAQLLRIQDSRRDGDRDPDAADLAAIHAEIRASYDRIATRAGRGTGEAIALLARAEALLEQQLVPGLRAIVELDQDRSEEELAQLDGFAAAILALALLVGALSIALSLATPYLLQRYLVRPVLDLSDAFRRFRAGETEVRPVVQGSNELGYLAHSLAELMGEMGTTTQRARALANFDRVTGLPTRDLFRERLNKVLVSARVNGHMAAILTLDMDALRRISETLGHDSGDEIMRQAAERICESLRNRDMLSRPDSDDLAEDTEMPEVSRISGNEFTILLRRLATPQDASIVAERLLKSLTQRFKLDGEDLFLSLSIGIAAYPLDGGDANALLRNASAAAQAAKSRGNNHFQFYSKSMNSAAARKMHIRSRLAGALDRNDMALYYQPIRHAQSGALAGAEALLRWTDPEIGPVAPSEFVPIAEESGLISSIGEWALYTACRQAQVWQQARYQPFRMSVNVSAREICEAAFVGMVSQILEDTGLDPALFEFEVTETAMMQDGPQAATTLRELRDMGISIALDDFGTGYSSLSHLLSFPINRLKIDRSFVTDIAESEQNAKLAGAIVAMAHYLDLKVVAEGVENEEQANFLRERGCDYLQGYLFSRAMPAEEFERFLEKEKSR